MSRLLLQTVNGAVAIATLALGSVQLAAGSASPIYRGVDMPSSAILDSNLRFFGGMGVGLALLMLWSLPSIEDRRDVVVVFWLCAFLGGLGRLVSLAVSGVPSSPLVAFTVVEVVGAPLVVYWHRVVTRAGRPEA